MLQAWEQTRTAQAGVDSMLPPEPLSIESYYVSMVVGSILA